MKQSKAISEFYRMQVEDITINHPLVSYPDSFLKKYKFATHNGLKQAIKHFIKLRGGQCEVINTMGRMIDQRKTYRDVLGRTCQIGSMQYIPTTGTKGSSDLSALFRGRTLKIEIKVGRDVQREDQVKYQKSIEAAGGTYRIIRSFDEFYDWWMGEVEVCS